ncbi:MAG: YifB family Mg chelatase-like AAA ATPase, partial [Bdellovibrionales bacterium]|nr:YifB family Mg chelatase-like AAA ATPase [Bdellovibrionales bacterium]
MAAYASSTALIGIDAVRVEVEAQVISALKRFAIVGLPDGVVREAKDRVRCAIQNSGLSFPDHEVIVSLAPASLPKFGARFDLAIALSVLAADGQLDPHSLRGKLILGELALDGRLKPVPGDLASAIELRRTGGGELLLPYENASFAATVEGISVIGMTSLLEAVSYLQKRMPPRPLPPLAPRRGPRAGEITFRDVVGQHAAKRALEVAAAGGHNLLMVGPPGAGKSMLAQRVNSILPPLTNAELLEVQKIYSAGKHQQLYNEDSAHGYRPFRAPHHTLSTAGLIGGGSNPLPGEVSLAHCGVLFLDEFAEMRRDSLESLREPLETGRVSISRAKLRVSFPANFILIAAMNPCPCGKRGSQPKGSRAQCVCAPVAVQRYQSKLSGPI